MKIHKLIIALGMMVSCCAFGLRADDTTLSIHLKDNSKIVLKFADEPKIKFNRANALIISSNATQTMVQGFSTVTKITFDTPVGGIDDITADSEGTIKATGRNTFTLVGFKAGTPLTVTGLNGVVHLSSTIEGPDSVDIPLDDLTPGYYLIAAGDVVCKVAIKQ